MSSNSPRRDSPFDDRVESDPKSLNPSAQLAHERMQFFEKVTAGLLFGGLALGSFLYSRYEIAQTNQQLIKTGLGIPDMIVSKKSIIWPFQTFQRISLNPKTLNFHLNHMSKEKVPFSLPVTFTVMPHDPEDSNSIELFKNYARTMTNCDEKEMINTIKSVIHGETRILTASLTVEELFSDRERFKSTVTDKIQLVLNQFGLKISNANIEEIQDLPGSEIFKFLRLKATESITNESRVHVAEAKKIGDIGQAEREAQAKQKIARFYAETIQVQNERDLEVAESSKKLEVSKAEFKREIEIAQLNAEKARDIKEAELQREVEEKRIHQEKEALRAIELVRASVKAEAAIAESSGLFESRKILADAEYYESTKRAEGQFAIMEAEAAGKKSLLIAEAEGNRIKYESEANGMELLLNSCKQNISLLQFHLAIRTNLFPQLAAENAKAMMNLKPKITIWNQGGENNGKNYNGKNSPLNSINSMITQLPPVLDVLKDHTGIDFIEALKGQINGGNSETSENSENSISVDKTSENSSLHSPEKLLNFFNEKLSENGLHLNFTMEDLDNFLKIKQNELNENNKNKNEKNKNIIDYGFVRLDENGKEIKN